MINRNIVNGYKVEDLRDEDQNSEQDCWHIAVVSISDKETQCMDCLRKWPKRKDFISDFPELDRGGETFNNRIQQFKQLVESVKGKDNAK